MVGVVAKRGGEGDRAVVGSGRTKRLVEVPAILHAAGEPRAWPSRGIGVSVLLAPGNP